MTFCEARGSQKSRDLGILTGNYVEAVSCSCATGCNLRTQENVKIFSKATDSIVFSQAKVPGNRIWQPRLVKESKNFAERASCAPCGANGVDEVQGAPPGVA
jgi:hypothetical protein